MTAHTEKPARLIAVVAEDRLSAWLHWEGEPTEYLSALSVEDARKILEEAGVAVSDAVQQRVEALIESCQSAHASESDSESPLAEPFLVARGRAPVDAQDGRFEWADELAAKLKCVDDEDAQIDYFAINAMVTVAADTVIGRVVPPTDGAPGVDVTGQVLPPRKPKGAPVRLGTGVCSASEDAPEIVAKAAGRVVEAHGEVRIDEVLNVTGDVDFESGSIDACVDVAVRGTVRSQFTVHTTKSLHVDRVIEAADVEAGEDITVRGGVFGHDGVGHVRAGGQITALFFNDTVVSAGGDVRFVKEILNARLHTSGHVIGLRGTILGGDVYAREGIEVRVIGSEAAVATQVAIGIHVNTLRHVRQLDRRVEAMNRSAGRIRGAIEPLMANLKRLLPEQRERATELLCKADEIELEVDGLKSEAFRLLEDEAPRDKATLLVNEAAYPGAHILIDAHEHRVRQELNGPIKIELRKVDSVTEMVAVNQRTGSVTVLPSAEVDLNVPPPADEGPGGVTDGTDKATANDRER